ncbi:hypothetical protein [Streptomyces sp. SLBN-118]|nr:hypothetical protein [Streptomyces sp. SLBN-118]
MADRIGQDLDVAAENRDRIENIADAVRAGLEERGWPVRALE